MAESLVELDSLAAGASSVPQWHLKRARHRPKTCVSESGDIDTPSIKRLRYYDDNNIECLSSYGLLAA